MGKTKHLFLLLMLLVTFVAKGQLSRDLWFDGMVELEGGERLKGKISYYSDFKNALLQIQTGGKTLSFDANQLVFFRFFDEELGLTRTFYSLPYSPGGTEHTIMLFFEALIEGGHLSALSKTEFRVETRQPNMPYSYRGHYIPSWYGRSPSRTYSVVVPYETIYLVTPDTPIEAYNYPTSLATRDVRFRKPKDELLMELVRDQGAKIEEFMEKNKLDVRNRKDLLHVIRYYNELKDQSN